MTKISTIPRTSLFLTGSKDGDVKLWDAKAARLIHHWPKLHERHTFLQPTSKGYGGIVRVSTIILAVICSSSVFRLDFFRFLYHRLKFVLLLQAGVTDMQVCPNGFITCGGDGTVKFVSLRDS